MDGIDDYIWQRRIHHGVRHQKCTVPFPESVEIGLEFNAALERKETLDLSLLTNAVMLELCDFAKTVTKSETYFFFEMLEFNFDLGLDMDNDLQCYEYARRTHNKVKLVKEQIKAKPHRWKETFPLPDRNAIMEATGSERWGRYYHKRNKIVDSSLLTDGSKNSPSSENKKTESDGAVNSSFVIKKPGGFTLKLTDDAYPFCKELGVTLTVRPDDTSRQKLDPSLLTNGVMMELLDFARVLCGTHTGIVHDLVKLNFGQELDKLLFRLQVSKLMERKYACIKAEDRNAFLKEPFKILLKKQEQDRKKRKKPDPDYQELETLTKTSKRRGALKHTDNDEAEIWQDSDLSYMCPVDFDSEMQSDMEDEPEKEEFESCLSETAAETAPAASPDVKQEEEEVLVSSVQPQMNGHDSSSFNCRPTLEAASDKEHQDSSIKTHKQKLWMRRVTRSKQILESSRVNDLFASCRAIALDFDVGSGNKQNMDLQLLTNSVLWEINRFATAMRKSLFSFLFDVLDKNFDLTLQQDEPLKYNFLGYIMTKEKALLNHPARHSIDFLSSPFHFPKIYNMVDVTSDFKTKQDAEAEQQTDCDSPPASATSEQADVDPHPFCSKLGLNLWSPEERSQKLDLSVLTTGAMFEILHFVRELRGTIREMVNDVLEHNFGLDLRSGATEAAQVIDRWFKTQKNFMKKPNSSLRINRWLNTVIPLNGHSKRRPKPATRDHLKDEDTTDFSVRQVKREDSFHICEEIGLDLDVHSKSEAKTKLDLRVLTRGVLFEIHRYVGQNCNHYVPALFEILDYNFDLSSQSHRKVEFAWSIASQVLAIAGKQSRTGNYLNAVFELPFEVSDSSQIVCKEELEDSFSEPDPSDTSDVMFVQELKPVDIEVELD